VRQDVKRRRAADSCIRLASVNWLNYKLSFTYSAADVRTKPTRKKAHRSSINSPPETPGWRSY